LLISAEFINSDYCYDVELRRAIARHDAGEARVIPIILRPCDWLKTPFGKLQALPRDGKSVSDSLRRIMRSMKSREVSAEWSRK
jgi:hypothetical protein